VSLDWKHWGNFPFPYKNNTLSDPQYIKDKEELFAKHGNGWWWGDGWWNGKFETPMERQQRYRREKAKAADAYFLD
jgi:hypothetical protein